MAKKYVVDKKEPEKKKQEKESMFKRIRRFFKETRAELKKVIWPTREQWVKLSVAVMVFTLAFGILSGGFDYLMTALIRMIGM